MSASARRDALMGVKSGGVLYGVEAPVPASGLTLTYTEGLVRVETEVAPHLQEYRIAGSTIAITASSDGYVYVNGADGVITKKEVANGGAKPPRDDSTDGIGSNSEFLFKVVTDATDITAVTDLRRDAGEKVILVVPVSFEATEVGDSYVIPGFRGRLIAVDGIVANALTATDAGSVTPSIVTVDDVAVAVTNGALSFAASAAVGVRDLEVPSAANAFGPFDRIKLVSAKATAGGYAIVNLVLERND